MKNEQEPNVPATADQRRRFLRLFGASAALLPITAIVGCSDDAAPPPASPRTTEEAEPASRAESAPESMMRETADDAEAMVEEAADGMEAAMENAAEEAESMIDEAEAMAEEAVDDMEAAMEDAAEEAESMIDDAVDGMEAAVDEVTSEPPGEPMAGDMPPVDLNDPTAQSLGYKHDANNVDAARYPNRNPAHLCSNCILYQGAAGDEWGGCALFPGKAVNANGWCSSYTPKAS